MADPLEIGVIVNTADLAKLAEASQQVAENLKALTVEFVKGNISSADFQAGIAKLASSTVEANPALISQTNALREIQAQQAAVSAEVSKSKSMAIESVTSGAGAPTGGFQEFATKELAQEALYKQANKIAQEGLNVSLSGSIGPAKSAAAGSQAVAESAGVAATEVKALSETLSQAGLQANQYIKSVFGVSESTMQAGLASLEAKKNLALVTEQLALEKVAMDETGLTTDVATSKKKQYLETLALEAVLTKQAKEAQQLYSDEFARSQSALRTRPAAVPIAAVPAVPAVVTPAEVATVNDLTAAIARADAAENELTAAAERFKAATTATATAIDTGSQAEIATAKQEEAAATEALQTAEANLAAAKEKVIALNAGQATSEEAVTEAATGQVASTEAVATAAEASSTAAGQGAIANESLAASSTAVAATSGTAASFLQRLWSAITGTTTAVSANTAETKASLSPLGQAAQRYHDSGVAIKDLQSVLVNLGMSVKDARAAVTELTAAEAPLANETANVGNQAEGAAVKISGMDRVLAGSGARIGATLVGTGQLGYAFSRIAASSAVLAPIMASIFPVFAALAFIDIMGNVVKKLEEWSDIAQKSADEQANFERSLLKSAEAVDKMNEKLAGTFSVLAEDAERLAHFGDKVLDLNSEMEALNKRVEDGPGYWKNVKEALGEAFVNIGIIDKSERDLGIFNRQVGDSIKQQKDLAPAIAKVTEQLEKMRAEASKPLPPPPPVIPGLSYLFVRPSAEPAKREEENRRINLLQGELNSMKALQESFDTEKLAMQESIDEKLYAEQEKAVNARIALQETERKILETFHAITPEEALQKHLQEIEGRYDARKAKLQHELEGLQRLAQQSMPTTTATTSAATPTAPLLTPSQSTFVQSLAPTLPLLTPAESSFVHEFAAPPAAAPQPTTATGITVDQIAHAIADAEGFGKEGAVPTVNNNPGDIKDMATGTIKHFDTVAEGWDALRKQIQSMTSGVSPKYPAGTTLEQGGMTYSGQNPDWVKNVSAKLGVSPTTPLTGLVGTPSIGATPTAAGGVDMTKALLAKQQEIANVGLEEEKEKRGAVSAEAKKQLDETLSGTLAEISSEKELNAALDRHNEAVTKIKFQHADTIPLVTAASKEMIDLETAAFNHEAEAAKKAAEAKLDAFNAGREKQGAAAIAKPAAEFGTRDYATQLAPFKAFNEAMYNELIAANGREMAARENQTTKLLEAENDKYNKIRSIRSQQLTNQIADINNEVVQEREAYQDGKIALQAQLDEKKSRWSTYYSDIVALSRKELSEELATYAKETAAIQAAVAEGTKTHEEGSREIIAITHKEEEAVKAAKKRELEAAKEAIAQQEQAMKRVTDKIASDFARMGNTILTTHTSIGRAAMQLGRELELYIIEEGIKRVVTHYSQALLQMLAADNSWIIKVLGIHRAGAAAQEAVDAASQAKQTAVKAVGTAQRQGIDLAAFAKTATLHLTEHTTDQALEVSSVATHAVAETSKVGATVVSQAAQTAAAAGGETARKGIETAGNLKSIEGSAAKGAAKVYAHFADIPILAAILAAATFVAIMAFGVLASAAKGTVVGAKQPVLVHSGEIITHSQTLSALGSPSSATFASSASASHAMTVERDQVTTLEPGMVVVPKGLAGGLMSVVQSMGGKVTVAEGSTPPSDIIEIPQRLPSNVTATINSIVDRHSQSAGIQGGSMLQKIPAAAAGFVVQSKGGSETFVSARDGFMSSSREFVSAKEGYVLSAESGAVMPSHMAIFAHAAGVPSVPGAAGGPGGRGGDGASGNVIHNHRNQVNINVHQQGSRMTPDEITRAVRKGMRRGY